MSNTPTDDQNTKQGHLNLFHEHYYRGLPVQVSRGPLIEEYLERLYQVVQEALMDNSRIFAVRVDLRFPAAYWPLEGEALGNSYIRRFWDVLKYKLSRYEDREHRMHPANLRYAWAREYKAGEAKPHFHLLILLNGHAFNRLGSFNYGGDNLYNLITESWANALMLPELEGKGLAYFPHHGQYLLRRGVEWELQELFLRGSYLTKAATKRFDDRLHSFRTSQVSIRRSFW
ncbi:inovirus Gp2 family protein [Marinimicrobium agarilyticum]|uniref:inovirus Gp2 family protein n=1 Tax=Marinimicrobium agarilyticum TaxID=306546 RepID=UPI0003FB2AA2|nr:inovirus Gp2 family protein [Marinimicrobium agarilyticum]